MMLLQLLLFDVGIAQGLLLFLELAFRGVPLPGRGVDNPTVTDMVVQRKPAARKTILNLRL